MKKINIDQFYAFTTFNKKNGCLEWTKKPSRTGYGLFNFKNEELAHRVSWIINKGKIKNGLCVLHKCDNRICVNVDHLFLGTKGDNARDMVKKGRHGMKIRGYFGQNHYMSKLKEHQVIKILKSRGKFSQSNLAKKYNITTSAIQAIMDGRTWKYIDRSQFNVG